MHKHYSKFIFIVPVLVVVLLVIGFLVLKNDDSSNSEDLVKPKTAEYCSSDEFYTKVDESEVLYRNNPELLIQYKDEITSLPDYKTNADCMYIVMFNSLINGTVENIDTDYQELVVAYDKKPYSEKFALIYNTPTDLKSIIESIKQTKEYNSKNVPIIDNSSGGGSVAE